MAGVITPALPCKSRAMQEVLTQGITRPQAASSSSFYTQQRKLDTETTPGANEKKRTHQEHCLSCSHCAHQPLTTPYLCALIAVPLYKQGN
jgi:hypothetical protein